MQLFHFFICSLACCPSSPLEQQLQDGTPILPSIPRVQLRAWYRNGAQQTFVEDWSQESMNELTSEAIHTGSQPAPKPVRERHGQAPKVAQRKSHPSPWKPPKDSLPNLDLAAAPAIPAVPWDLANYLHTVDERGHHTCQTHAWHWVFMALVPFLPWPGRGPRQPSSGSFWV